MSLSSGPAGGKGVDSGAVDAYDSGDEWDIGVGNLIIDLDADLEKDKLEMSSGKEGGGAMAAPPGGGAALPDSIKFVSPAGAAQGKESKNKSKRSKNSKEGAKAPVSDGAKKEVRGRPPGEPLTQNPNSTTPPKGADKSGKPPRAFLAVKKDKDGVSGKTKKEKMEVVATGGLGSEKDSAGPLVPAGATRAVGPFEGQQNPEEVEAEQLGTVESDPTGAGPPDEEEEEEEEEDVKTVTVKMESPVSTPAPPLPPPPPLHLLAPVTSSDISSPCEQIMVRTRSVAVNTADAALGTEPECLGPCEPGTSVNLEGIVWQETEDGMLVVNVTWRNKTYVGTLLDCTRHDWAPPRFCESPSSDVEMRSGRGRGKRMRPSGNTPLNDNSNSSDNRGSGGGGKTRGAAAGTKGRRGSQTAGAAEDTKASPSSAKRKLKPASDMEPTSSSEDTKASKRMRTDSTGAAGRCEAPPPPQPDRTCPSPVLIDCPHPSCNKRYKHVNGLKYHQARAHNEHDVRLDQDGGDSEYGDDPPALQPDPASCNGAAAVSPARSTTPKGRGFDAPSPSPGKQTPKGKKKAGETEPEGTDGGGEEAACLTDEASNDKMAAGGRADKLSQKGVKPGRPNAPSPYGQQAASPAPGSVVQPVPKSPQLKNVQSKPPPPAADPASSPTPPGKDKKKKDKKKREGGKEGDSPRGKGGRPEEGRSPYSDSSDALLNGSTEAHQSRLASIKAEADKVYSFSDNAPSPSIGAGSRMEAGLNQNGADQTGSPAYSDISDAGEDGEGGRAEGVRVKTEPDQGPPREGAKKALFPPHSPSKEPPYYPNYDSYYSPSYPNLSPGAAPAAPPHVEGAQVKVKKEKEEEPEVEEEVVKLKVEPQEERKVEAGPQQLSVIQQRPTVYAQPLYYNQYYAPPYSYSPDQAYHAHLLASNSAYRQQYEDRQRPPVDKKAEGKEREACAKEEWKQKASGPPALSRAPSLTDLGAKGGPNPAKPKEPPPAAEQSKSVIMAKAEDQKAPAPQPEGLKMKLSEAGHHGKEEAKPAGVEPAMWYRQEPDSRLWPYVYPNKYSEAPKPQEEEHRWKEDRERERDRKGKEERPRPKEALQKEEAKEGGAEGRTQLPPEEQHRGGGGKEARPPSMQFTSPLAQHHQGYMPYMHGPYAYSHGYEPSHPGYRGLPSVMMQNYPGYLPAGYSFPSYGSKVSGGEELEKASSRSSPTVKPPGEAKALELLQQHASQYKSKSPSVQDHKSPHERDREGDRPRASASQRMLPSHHHLGYPLLSGQYDLSYASGLSSSAIVASQQASAPSMYPPARR
ncbi:zinc finger protein 609a [Clinocottus analis]|uniref:zinc finger protein 609a n=1 Tax=Clinocottus analis TaxID=304258 RepID=UPI0035C13B53